MATTNLNASQNRTVVNSIFGNTSFADTRNDTTGGFLFDGPDGDYYGIAIRSFNYFGTNYFTFGHPFMDFDLSSISDTITGVSLLLEGKTSTNYGSSNNYDGDAIILLGEFADTLGNSDMNKYVGHTSGWGASDVTELSSAFGPAGGGSWNTSGTNTINLNSDAVTAAENARQAGNRLKLCLVNYSQFYLNDAGNLGASSTPTYYKFNFHNDLGEADEPILQVTHDAAAATTTGPFKLEGGSKVQVISGKFLIK